MRRLLSACVLGAALYPSLAAQDVAAAQDESRRVRDSVIEGLTWREVGPYRGGRSCAVTGIASQRDTYYMGTCGGGVWKTQDGGRSWNNVSDGFFGGSVGSVAVSEWDPNVVYVGTGEKTVRGNVSHGDGMWKSTDAGRTWKHVGLEDSRHIARVRVHPKNPDLVYAAAMGHLFGPNDQRGVFRSKDGGETWERVLFVNEHAGCVDLCMDPTNARILYATFWRIKRTPYSLESGGEGSTLWKSTDGGDTWTEFTDAKGLPSGTRGIAGISVSASNPDNVYLILESQNGGVFRSRNAGETWSKVNDERSLRQRAWYYTRIYADPTDEDVVYVLNVGFHRSKDGGKTYERISVPHGDNHDLWIDPNDADRMIQSNDGGSNVSYDGAKTWSPQDNQPTAQMYRVSADNAFPYNLLGGQQDNSTVRIASRNLNGSSITERDWTSSAGGESGHVVAKPDNPNIVFGGSYGGYLVWVNHETNERRNVHVWPDSVMGWGAGELKYRFQWNFPIFFSPHDPETVYCAAQVLFRSRNLGQSWERISPDLTRDEKSMQGASGGPITGDNTGVEYYCTIFAAAESQHEKGVFWCGSDDGLVHLSRDDGESWENVTPPQLPEWAIINCIDVHPFEKGGLYVAATRYKSDDFRPYLYRTLDYGRTWTEITAGIDPAHFTRAIRADASRPGLLYAGTERGVYVSFDDGGSWQSLQCDLPIVPITDLAVKDGDLIAATQGRGYWILDEIELLHQVDRVVGRSHLFEPTPAWRIAMGRRRGGSGNAGQNPEGGLTLEYWLDGRSETKPKIALFDGEGELIREFGGKGGGKVASEAGLNKFSWNLRYPDADDFDGLVMWNRSLSGPTAVPGTYTARLTVGKTVHSVPFEVKPDPRSSATMEDYRSQFEHLTTVRNKLDQTHKSLKRVRETRAALKELKGKLGDDSDEVKELRKRIDAVLAKMKDAEEALYQTKSQSRQDPLNFPIRLNDKLGALNRASGGFGPTEQEVQVREMLTQEIDKHLSTLEAVFAKELPAIDAAAKAAGVSSFK